MNLDDSVAQISSMCPSFTHDEIKHDLSITNSVERTVNRLLDRSISYENEAQPVLDFSSDDEELPVIFNPSSKPNSCKATTLINIPSVSSAKPSNGQISIILDSDEEDKESAKILNKTTKSAYHSMSDSSEDESCVLSLRDRILGSVSNNSSKPTSVESSPLLEPISASKRKHSLENNVKGNILHSGNLNSEFISNEGEFSERSEYSDGNTERWSMRSESQSTISCVSLSQSSECSGGEVIKKKRTKEEIAILKREAENRKKEKKKAREEKVLEKEQEKQRKEQIRIAEREMKKQMGGSKDCLQVTLKILKTIIFSLGGHGVAIFKSCETLGIKYVTEEQAVPFSITWRRQITSINVSEENQTLIHTEQKEREKESKRRKGTGEARKTKKGLFRNRSCCLQGQYGVENEGPTLKSYVHTIKQHIPNSILSFVVIGMEKYFRDQKTKVQRKHRAAVLSSERVDTSTDPGSVNRLDVEEGITDNQLQTDVMVYLLETSEELAEFVRTFSKAVAEKPAKKDRLQSAVFDDGVATVKVDKNGQGLLKVWKQQLMQFKNISPDIADAIVVAYPSPHLLMEAYRKCSDSNEQQKLLENIVVRRGAGVLETSRRVGKEMSRRIYTFMLSDNPNEIIK
ncbi:crossover junction endonuclease EME1-like [Saccostrea cucullata]|uniref:crossover junction endonuclease EME1-like n=1 Tax=Saccostrea cuccullata TaxID=36930 RepID=UPI002ED2A873